MIVKLELRKVSFAALVTTRVTTTPWLLLLGSSGKNPVAADKLSNYSVSAWSHWPRVTCPVSRRHSAPSNDHYQASTRRPPLSAEPADAGKYLICQKLSKTREMWQTASSSKCCGSLSPAVEMDSAKLGFMGTLPRRKMTGRKTRKTCVKSSANISAASPSLWPVAACAKLTARNAPPCCLWTRKSHHHNVQIFKRCWYEKYPKWAASVDVCDHVMLFCFVGITSYIRLLSYSYSYIC